MRYLLSLIAVCVIFFGCKKSDNSKPQLDTEKTITSFSFSSGNNTQLTSDVVATIDQTNKKITAVLPAGVSLNNLKASFTISAKATVTISGVTQISGVTSNNYANSLSYTVKAEDNTTQDYTVILSSTVIILQNSITNFSFTTANNPMLTANINATIDQANSKINIVFPEGVPLNNLKASFIAAANATVTVGSISQISGVTSNNFSIQFSYKVTTQNNSSQTYLIMASVNTTGPSVYVAGVKEYGSGSLVRVWKNGIATDFSDGTKIIQISDMYVSGNDIYVVGNEESGAGYKIAKLWKNGVSINLSGINKNATAHAVYVDGNDVYIVGEEQHPTIFQYSTAKVWKNGVETNLTSGLSEARATDVFVANGDVYISGLDGSNPSSSAKLWKNGVSMGLNVNGFNAEPLSITVLGNDVYVLGRGNGINGYNILLWKNGVVTEISNPAFNSSPVSIISNGTDIYISGYETSGFNTSYQKKYWKNGVATVINNTFGSSSSFGIFVYGNDVYVASTELVYIPMYAPTPMTQVWKNGQPLGLNHSPLNTSYGKCVFIK